MPRFPHVLWAATGLLLTAAFGQCTSSQMPQAAAPLAPALGSQDFTQDWQFVKDRDTTITPALFAAGGADGWAPVSLPHTAQLEPIATGQRQWQGIGFYRKFFRAPAAPNQRVTVHFGAAMHTADVYLNGQRLQRHVGGYLPFEVNLTGKLRPDQDNCLLVRLNNQDDPAVPPGKPLKELDFNFYHGLYRTVELRTKAPLHITDPVQAGRTAGGGMFVSYGGITPEAATLRVQTEVQNDHSTAQSLQVRAVLRDERGREVGQSTQDLADVPPGSFGRVVQQISVNQPRLWSPEQPYLYRLTVEVRQGGQVLDRQELTTGVRSIRFAPDGFYLNGQKLRLRGTNRHQEYPYLGYALSDAMQYRDAWKIREAGFNFVRCSHYPPAPAFLQACDELGILVMDAIPGWQFFGDAAFQRNSLQNVRDMVRRDRNHPSVVLWEAALNETGMSKPFMDEAHRIVHEELPFKEGVYTCGWMDYAYDVFIPARQHAKAPDYWNKYSKGRPILLCEYGDWEYYAQNAGFNQKAYEGLKAAERTSRQLRGQGERALAQQALNFQEAHNDNFRGPAVGDANWLMFDYLRGYAPDIESSGVADIFRVPKFAYYFYQSQYGSATDRHGFGRPMVYIANYWLPTSSKEVVVYSNAEEVELLLNGQPVARQKPDRNAYADRLAHPPFTFTLPTFTPGTLRAVAYQGGKRVAETERRTPGAPARLALRYDRSGRDLTAGQNDAVFVYATVVDANGEPVPQASPAVRFVAEGPAELLGPSPVPAEAGTASALLRAGQGRGTVRLTATADGLTPATLDIPVR
ncbi:glycoside hydrolase family 2 TIM barrel-domain containing protein [Hymenobacter coalescens]